MKKKISDTIECPVGKRDTNICFLKTCLLISVPFISEYLESFPKMYIQYSKSAIYH